MWSNLIKNNINLVCVIVVTALIKWVTWLIGIQFSTGLLMMVMLLQYQVLDRLDQRNRIHQGKV